MSGIDFKDFRDEGLNLNAIERRAIADPLGAYEDTPALIARVRDLEERCLRLAEEVVDKARELDETEEECVAAQTRAAELEAIGRALLDVWDDDTLTAAGATKSLYEPMDALRDVLDAAAEPRA